MDEKRNGRHSRVAQNGDSDVTAGEDRPGDWRALIVGSQTNDRWEMKIAGPNGFERWDALEGSQGKHRPETIRTLLGKLVPRIRLRNFLFRKGE